MQEEKKPDVILETTLDATTHAKTIIRTARSGAIATVDPTNGWPIATRVGMSTDVDGTPIILISRLAAHTGALLADPRCSLLVGYPGKGDPLAHARVSLACKATEIPRDTPRHEQLDNRYLSHQSKAKLYSSLGDFRYFRLEVQSASFNAGFGRAYALTAADLVNAHPANAELAESEIGVLTHMNDDHHVAVGLYAEHFAKAAPGNWRLIGVDAEGIDLADGDDVRRIWFEAELATAKDIHMMLVRMAGEARRALGRPLQDARA